MPITACGQLIVGMDGSYTFCPAPRPSGQTRCTEHVLAGAAAYVSDIQLQHAPISQTIALAQNIFGPGVVSEAQNIGGHKPPTVKENGLIDFVDLAKIIAGLDASLPDRDTLAREAAEYCSERFGNRFKPTPFFEAFRKATT